MVAVLTIFSTQHELSNPAAIPIFLSFFVIIFWLWVSQTAYDMRYQGNDALNRFFKFLQIGLFIYQGAAGGNWNPGRIDRITDDDPYGARSSQHGMSGSAMCWTELMGRGRPAELHDGSRCLYGVPRYNGTAVLDL